MTTSVKATEPATFHRTKPLVKVGWKAQIWGLDAQPGPILTVVLGALPFLLLIGVYVFASHLRHLDNPSDKLLPSLTQMFEAMKTMALEEDPRSGSILLWLDTTQSLVRIGTGMAAAGLAGLLTGVHLGVFAQWRAGFLPLVTFMSIIPPLALLPILFIVFGVDEFAKIALIFIGVYPIIARDIFGAVAKLPAEQRTKSQTLGADGIAYLYWVVMPQVLPRLVETVRLSMGSAWLFLIASEAIAADAGLGYRIFLVRRYLSMDIIIPYALWITLLGFSLDYILKSVNKKWFKWYVWT